MAKTRARHLSQQGYTGTQLLSESCSDSIWPIRGRHHYFEQEEHQENGQLLYEARMGIQMWEPLELEVQ